MTPTAELRRLVEEYAHRSGRIPAELALRLVAKIEELERQQPPVFGETARPKVEVGG